MCVDNIILCLHYIATFAFALGGGAIIAAGVVWSKQTSDFSSGMDSLLNSPVFVLIAVGAILCLLAFLGWCGACTQSYCLLLTYATLLGLIFIGQVILVVVLFMYGTNPNELLNKSLMTELDSCTPNSSNFDLFKNLQQQLNCCGVNSVGDFIIHGQCASLAGYCPTASSVITGCASALADHVSHYANIVAGVAIGVAVLEVLGAIAGCTVASWVKKQY